LLLSCIRFWCQLISHEGNGDINNFLYEIKPSNEFVVVDMEGPGCLNRGWLYYGKSVPSPSITLRLDNQTIFSGNAKDVFSSGADGRFPSPFFSFLNDDTGMDLVYPFCFSSNALLSLTWGGQQDAFQTTNDCVRDGSDCSVVGFTDFRGERMAELPSGWDQHDYEQSFMPPKGDSWADFLSFASTLKRITEEAGTERLDFSLDIEPGAESTMFDFSDAMGALTAITITLPKDDWSKLDWEMSWDGANEPQVQIPLDRMFNSWIVGSKPLMGYHLGAWEENSEVHGYVFNPMPFLKSAMGRVKNKAETSATIKGTIWYQKGGEGGTPPYTEGTFGYYCSRWIHKPWGPCFNELLSLEDQTGHIVGHSWVLDGGRLQWVENDPVVYTDDGRTPKLWYSGLEDETGGAHGFHFFRELSSPFYGWDFTNDGRYITAYVNLFQDRHYFMKNYIYGIQGHNNDGQRQLDYAFHWYASPHASMTLSDEIDLGDDSSLDKHQYYAEPASEFVNLTSATTGQWYYYVSGFSPANLNTHTTHDCPEAKKELISRRGVVMTTGKISFLSQVDNKNQGVILRRLIDLYYSPQRARVSVDGQYVGIWLTSDHGTEYAPQRFADNTDFIIPSKFTHGKYSIEVSLEIEPRDGSHWTSAGREDYNTVQGFAWTAFHYWVYSMTPSL